MTLDEIARVIPHPRFVYCGGDIVHIKTPAWVCSDKSLFTCYDPVLFCGYGQKANEHGLALRAEILDAIPGDKRLCEACARRIADDFLPFVEGGEDEKECA